MHSGKTVIRTRQCVAFISNAAEIGWVSSKLSEKDFKDKSSIYQQNFKQIHIKSIQSMPIEQHIIRETVIVVWTYSTSTEEFYSVSHVVQRQSFKFAGTAIEERTPKRYMGTQAETNMHSVLWFT